MAMTIELTHYDPTTKRYRAQLTVTDADKTYTYGCEGTWHDNDAPMVAGALHDQHVAAMATAPKADAEKATICAAILAEVEKKAAAAAEVK